MSSKNSDLADFFRKSRIQAPKILINEKLFEEILESVNTPLQPTPALILALDRARRIRESAQK
jgi:hypothetical protein